MSENVLAFPADLLNVIGSFNGFHKDGKKYLQKIITSNQLQFLNRDEAEKNVNFKQLIPYHILKYQDLLFTYQRHVNGNEERLHGSWSLGVGGHINDKDGAPDYIGYHEGRLRELKEEIKINSNFKEDIIGVINDDSTVVGQVHFGVVHLLELEEPAVEVVDNCLNQAAFLPLDLIKKHYDVFETWSQCIIDNIL